MKRILTTLSQKWPEYLLEILVLIIGIYGAFALENWNEKRKLEELAAIHLDVLSKDLELDRAELISLKSKIEQNEKSAHKILNQYKLIEPMDSGIYNSLADLILEYSFTPQTTALNSLENSGSLTVLSELLQQQISIYYAQISKVKEREEISNQFIKDKYEPLLLTEYSFIWNKNNSNRMAQNIYANDLRNVEPFNKSQFANNKVLEVMVFGRLYQIESQNLSYKDGLIELEKLNSMINSTSK